MTHSFKKYAEVVSSKHFGLLDLKEIVYFYIPMTKGEAGKHKIIDGCWRFRLL